MLHLVDARLKRIPVVVVEDLDRLLQDDRARVHPLVDEEHRHAGHLHARRRARPRPRASPGTPGGATGARSASGRRTHRASRVRAVACTRRSPWRRSRDRGGGPPRLGRTPLGPRRPSGRSTADSTPWDSARSIAFTPGRSESTRAIREPQTGWSRSACRFVPEPETSTAIRSATSPSTAATLPEARTGQAVRYPRGGRGADPQRPRRRTDAAATAPAERTRRPRPATLPEPLTHERCVHHPSRAAVARCSRLRGADLPHLRGAGPRPRDRSRVPGRRARRSRARSSRRNRRRPSPGRWAAVAGAVLAVVATIGPWTRTGAGDRLLGAWVPSIRWSMVAALAAVALLAAGVVVPSTRVPVRWRRSSSSSVCVVVSASALAIAFPPTFQVASWGPWLGCRRRRDRGRRERS